MYQRVSRSRHAVTLAWLTALVAVLALAGCAPASKQPELSAPAQSVQELLELRARNATDTAAYLRHVESTPLAQALASDSGRRKPGEKPTPGWAAPTVSRQETRSAEVKVVWKKSEKFKKWPAATLFRLRLIEGRWLVIDAVDSTTTAR